MDEGPIEGSARCVRLRSMDSLSKSVHSHSKSAHIRSPLLYSSWITCCLCSSVTLTRHIQSILLLPRSSTSRTLGGPFPRQVASSSTNKIYKSHLMFSDHVSQPLSQSLITLSTQKTHHCIRDQANFLMSSYAKL